MKSQESPFHVLSRRLQASAADLSQHHQLFPLRQSEGAISAVLSSLSWLCESLASGLWIPLITFNATIM